MARGLAPHAPPAAAQAGPKRGPSPHPAVLPSSLHIRYPLFLAGTRFEGTFHFKDTHHLVEHSLAAVDETALRLPEEPL